VALASDTQTQGLHHSQPHQYTGEPRDEETGLVQLRARVAYPDEGRLLQRDRFAGSLTRPQSLNRYTYVQNNPVNLVDPSGLAPAKSVNLTNCFTVTPLFGPPIQVCFPSTGGGQGTGQTQRQTVAPCPVVAGDRDPPGIHYDQLHGFVRGPERHLDSTGNPGECHVNIQITGYSANGAPIGVNHHLYYRNGGFADELQAAPFPPYPPMPVGTSAAAVGGAIGVEMGSLFAFLTGYGYDQAVATNYFVDEGRAALARLQSYATGQPIK
jgi:RHS repeat-associated protein